MEIDIIVDNVLNKLGLDYIDSIGTKEPLLLGDLVYGLILTGTIKETSNLLNIGSSKLEHILHRHVKIILNKTTKEKWDYWLLKLVDLKRCPQCSRILCLSEFAISSNISLCKECDNTRSKEYRLTHLEECRVRSVLHYNNNKNIYYYRNANRRAMKVKATPSWVNLEKIKEMYLNCPKGYHVDHIVPLKGVLVCGLHVENNLQYLSVEDNKKKSNYFSV